MSTPSAFSNQNPNKTRNVMILTISVVLIVLLLIILLWVYNRNSTTIVNVGVGNKLAEDEAKKAAEAAAQAAKAKANADAAKKIADDALAAKKISDDALAAKIAKDKVDANAKIAKDKADANAAKALANAAALKAKARADAQTAYDALLAKYTADQTAYEAAVALAATCSTYQVLQSSVCVYKCADDQILSADGTGCQTVNLNQYEVIDKTTGKVVCAPGSEEYEYPGSAIKRCIKRMSYGIAPYDAASDTNFGLFGTNKTSCDAIGGKYSDQWNICEIQFKMMDSNDPNAIWFADTGKCPPNAKVGSSTTNTGHYGTIGWIPNPAGGAPLNRTKDYDVCKGPMVKGVSITPYNFIGPDGTIAHQNFPTSATDPNYKKSAVWSTSIGSNDNARQQCASMGGWTGYNDRCYLSMFNYSDTTTNPTDTPTDRIANATAFPFKTANALPVAPIAPVKPDLLM
jgi:hypothetical protein